MELRKISFHYLELKAEKDILMEIIWIFFNFSNFKWNFNKIPDNGIEKSLYDNH